MGQLTTHYQDNIFIYIRTYTHTQYSSELFAYTHTHELTHLMEDVVEAEGVVVEVLGDAVHAQLAVVHHHLCLLSCTQYSIVEYSRV